MNQLSLKTSNNNDFGKNLGFQILESLKSAENSYFKFPSRVLNIGSYLSLYLHHYVDLFKGSDMKGN